MTSGGAPHKIRDVTIPNADAGGGESLLPSDAPHGSKAGTTPGIGAPRLLVKASSVEIEFGTTAGRRGEVWRVVIEPADFETLAAAMLTAHPASARAAFSAAQQDG